ncbi:MAG TPA: hypothetical protein VF268_12505 [Gammaproteobacteria bacterium]
MRATWDFVSYRGKRYLENLLGLGIIVVLALIFFGYVNRLVISAEQATVQQTLSILRQSVQMYMFSKMLEEEQGDFAKYDGGNPFAMLAQVPRDYAGEYSAQDGVQVPAGRWYFDLDSRQAVYRFMNQPLRNEEAGSREIRLSLQYVRRPGNPLPLRLVQVETDKTMVKQKGTN